MNNSTDGEPLGQVSHQEDLNPAKSLTNFSFEAKTCHSVELKQAVMDDLVRIFLSLTISLLNIPRSQLDPKAFAP